MAPSPPRCGCGSRDRLCRSPGPRAPRPARCISCPLSLRGGDGVADRCVYRVAFAPEHFVVPPPVRILSHRDTNLSLIPALSQGPHVTDLGPEAKAVEHIFQRLSLLAVAVSISQVLLQVIRHVAVEDGFGIS